MGNTTEFLIDKRQKVSWTDESTFGDGGTMSSGEVVGLNCVVTPNLSQNWQEILNAGDDSRAVYDRVLGAKQLGFTLEFIPVSWKCLKYVGYDVTNTGSGPYTHTFNLANTINSFALEWAFQKSGTPVVLTLTGCFCKSMTINFQKATGAGDEGYIKITMDCVAQDYSIGSTVTGTSVITREPYQWRHTRVTIDNTEITEVNSGNITIETGINEDDSRYCNATLDRNIGEPIPKVHRVNGNVNVNLKDNTYLNLWDNGTAVSNCSLDFVQDNTNNKLESTLTDFKINTAPLPTTDFEDRGIADIGFNITDFGSLIATDTIATY